MTYDGITWKRCKIYDLNENEESEASQTTINETFSQDEPHVNFERNSFFIRPLNTGSTVTLGIRIWYEKRQTVLADGGIPYFEENLHDVLAFDLAEMDILRHARNTISEVAGHPKRSRHARETVSSGFTIIK